MSSPGHGRTVALREPLGRQVGDGQDIWKHSYNDPFATGPESRVIGGSQTSKENLEHLRVLERF